MSIVKNIFKQAANKLTYKANQLTYDPKAEAEALQQKATPPPGSAATNETNFNAYKGQWGARATSSGMIDPKYYGTYQSIFNIPVPPANANQETYDAAVNSLANAIKVWYVGAKYKGNLNELAFTIDATKPKYIPPTSGVKATVKPGPPPTATDQFMKGFLSTLVSTLMSLFAVFICLFAGSLAANDAIGRSPLMRFIAFVYSAIPFYTPFVLIYYIYRYFKGTYPMFYNFIPLTTFSSSNWLLSTLLWPFYYIEDANSQFQKAEYDRLGGLLVWMKGPATAEAAAATAEAAATANAEVKQIAAIKRAGLEPAAEKAMLAQNVPANNGRINNENTILPVPTNNGRMNNETQALNMVAKVINSDPIAPKPVLSPTN